MKSQQEKGIINYSLEIGFFSLFSRALFASLFEASKQILLRGWCIGARFFFFKKPIVCFYCCFYFLLCGSIPSEYVRFKCFGGLTRCCENVTATKTKMMCCTILVAKQKPGKKDISGCLLRRDVT